MRTTCFQVQIYDTRAEMGAAAAADIAAAVREVLSRKERCRMIFAAAPSQNEVLAAFAADDTVDFARVDAFHMDEYVGLNPDAPQGFGNFLKSALFGKAGFGSVSYIDCAAQVAHAECERYAALLAEEPIDIVVMGIGENGHIAFNDPHEADFDDPKDVKVVSLDETCRMQQVHDGCFADISQVPTHAITLTVPRLMRAEYHFCIVPAPTKAKAVAATVLGPVGADCPATSLRLCEHAILYLDADSSALLPGGALCG
ncbi:MAG: 6-phosphogluconolactonase [Clostridia bacterium]|nr:6-phosphogluconolactonase [Clostridia bacterium]